MDERGSPVCGNTMLILFNADHATTVSFHLPTIGKEGQAWELLFDTFEPAVPDKPWKPKKRAHYDIRPCSLAVFRSPVRPPEEHL